MVGFGSTDFMFENVSKLYLQTQTNKTENEKKY